jgi:hypothetical protein
MSCKMLGRLLKFCIYFWALQNSLKIIW